MTIEFDNKDELNRYITLYIEERIPDIVYHYTEQIIEVLEDNGFDIDSYFYDDINNC